MRRDKKTMHDAEDCTSAGRLAARVIQACVNGCHAVCSTRRGVFVSYREMCACLDVSGEMSSRGSPMLEATEAAASFAPALLCFASHM